MPGRTDAVDTVLRAGLIAAPATFALQGVLHLANLGLDRRFSLLDADSDFSAFAWTSSATTAAAAFAALLLAALLSRRSLALLGLVLAFFSLDDIVALHERVGTLDERLDLPEKLQLQRLVWVIVFMPLLAVAAVLLWRSAADAGGRTGDVVRAGLVLLVAAVAFEAATPVLFHFDWGQNSIPYETEVVFEEGCEVAGWILVASGLGAFACAVAERRRL